ncbi:plasmid stabilization system protein ParE [Rhizobium sp. PP-F2F-G48]|uniref:type II toxin-antitoxin system RelE/ParE family toxin n=1 Tax=Rhizobium sp. PP-F2F-G48 TaxID=2135651 RepID=UPI00104E391C|nr:type II toxin-antitoxin system RelE/ParE family toxin [Rhizobium sp. PP-F2F-G48]TCM54353.1 plasmid stabilization system protein ParE [Rhizobium sp. PP-F2F-G48]
MTQVKVSREAADFVRNEAAYLRRRNAHAAQRFSTTVRRARDILRTFDEAGSVTHGLPIRGGLTLVVDAYLFDYLREDGVVNIIAVRHGRMLQRVPDVEDDIPQDLAIDEPF